MSKKQSVKINFIYNTAYQVMTILIPLLTTPYLSRVLGADGIGTYSYSFSIANYFVLFAMLGLNNYGNRSIARVRDDNEKMSRLFCSIYAFQCITSLVVVIAYISFQLLVHPAGHIGWIMMFYVLSAGLDVNWFFWGLEEFKLTVTRNAIIKLITTISIFVFIKHSDDILLYSLIMSVSLFLSQILIWPFVLKRIHFSKVSFSEIKSHFLPNVKLFIPTIAVSVYKVMDKIMLGALSSTIEVGYYENADKILTIPICIVTSLGTVMLPRMSNVLAVQGTSDNAINMIKKSMIVALSLTAPLAIGLMAIAEIFVPLFYGDGFLKCITLFYILLPSCLFVAMANVIRTQYLIPGGHDKEYVLSCIVGAVVNLCLNILLIPRYQSVGAAIGTLSAEISVFVFQFNCTKNVLPYREILMPSLKILIGSIVMGVAVWILPSFTNIIIINLGIKVLFGVIIYSIFIFSIVFNKSSRKEHL